MDEDGDLKRRYRAFVKANHPDVGGDRDLFEQGLAELRAASARWWTQPDRGSPHDGRDEQSVGGGVATWPRSAFAAGYIERGVEG